MLSFDLCIALLVLVRLFQSSFNDHIERTKEGKDNEQLATRVHVLNILGKKGKDPY
jgi:hypothetical protein